MSTEPTVQAKDLEMELDSLTSFQRPGYLLRKAFSSVGVVLLIASGLLFNWIAAVVFAIRALGDVVWWQYLGGLAFFIALFPMLYIFIALNYGRSLVTWEAYREIIRPFIAKTFSKTLDKFLVTAPGEAPPVEENKIVKEVEERQKHFLEKLPDFLRAYVQLFFTGKDIIKIVRAQRASGQEKAQVKEKAMHSFFESLDLQISELFEPSYIPAILVAIANLALVYFLF